MQWKVRISMKEKFSLAIIFSIVWITIAIAIARATETGFRSIEDPVLLSLMEVLETSFGTSLNPLFDRC